MHEFAFFFINFKTQTISSRAQKRWLKVPPFSGQTKYTAHLLQGEVTIANQLQ